MAKSNSTDATPQRRWGRAMMRNEPAAQIEPAAEQSAIEGPDAQTEEHDPTKNGLSLASTSQWNGARRGRDRIAIMLRDEAMGARSSDEVDTRGDLFARHAHGLIDSEQPAAVFAAFQRGENATVARLRFLSGGNGCGSRDALANGRSSEILTSQQGNTRPRLLNSGRTRRAH